MEPLHAAPWRAVIVHQGLDQPVARRNGLAAFSRAIRREVADDGK